MKVIDQIGREVLISKPIKRIVSLVPSITELIVHLGLENELVGITKFCVHPKHLKQSKTIVGGTKEVHFERIRALKPDIILCNKEENTLEMVLELETIAPVHVSDIITLHDSLDLIEKYGVIFNKEANAEILNSELTEALKQFQNTEGSEKLKVGYFIWRTPWMVVGGNTFINSMLELNGWENEFSTMEGRYPEIDLEELKNLDLDLVLLSSEPFPFKEKHILEIQQYTSARIEIVNGEYFSWYGSRTLLALDYFNNFRNYLSSPL